MARVVMTESGHRCSVCGEPTPLELAHIISWHESKQHCASDLVCLCANCHQRADNEKWGEKTLRIYKKTPWILRKTNDALITERRSVVTFRLDLPYSEDDTHIRHFRFTLAGIFGIPFDSVEILTIEKGSIIITVALPEAVEPKLFNAIRTRDPYFYSELSKSWHYATTVGIVAEFIHSHRHKYCRKGDRLDDYRKAEYLIDIVNYLNQKRPNRIDLLRGEAREIIIDMVNNIFDSAYFRKMKHPEYSDDQCLLEAEREFCEEKEIDHLEYLLKDRASAEKFHAKKEIETLAYQQYQWRKKLGIPGDDKGDWVVAERVYPEWRLTKRIAMICWNLSLDKSKHQDYYWALACEVIIRLESEGLNNAVVDPYDPNIYKKIVEIVSANNGE